MNRLSRKNFLSLLFISLLLASVTLAGCKRINIGGENKNGNIESSDDDFAETGAQGTDEIFEIQASEIDIEESSEGLEDLGSSMSTENPDEEETNETLFVRFLNNEIAAFGEDGKSYLYKDDLCDEGATGLRPEPSLVDLDNDGMDEMVMDWYWGWYGGIYIDARDGKLYILAKGEGTAGVLHYIDYKGSTWIYYCDISHGGREMFWFERYQGADCMVESFSMYDEFWEGEAHTYSLNEEEISMEEYKALYEEIFQQEYIPREY